MSQIVRRTLGLGLSLGLPLAALALLMVGLPPAAQASNIVVSPCNATQLANAVAGAGDGDVISFSCSPGSHTIVVTQTQVLQHDLTIDGGSVITLSGGNLVRVLSVSAGHTVTLDNLTVRNGQAAQGGGLRVFGLAILHNTTFISNETTSVINAGGAAIYVADPGQLVAINSRFISNTTGFDGAAGGAIYSTGVVTTVNSLFNGNHAGFGGAISQNGGRAFLDSSTFLSNTALFGGAVAAYNNVVLLFDEFDYNQTNGTPADLQAPALITLTLGGGALNVAPNGQAAIDHSGFFMNSAENLPFGSGGAIQNDGSLGVLDSAFKQNNAHKAGGAITNHSSLTVERSDFTENNSADVAGAISNTGQLNLATSLLAGNTAATSGGAVENEGQAFTVVNYFYQNIAASGGGMRNRAGGSLTVGASSFSGNQAVTNSGGGLLNNGRLTVTNSTLVGNFSNSNGAALFSGGAGAAAALVNSTVVSNSTVAGAAGIRQTSGPLSLTNTIVSGNLPLNCVGAITNGGHNLQFGDTSCGAAIANANPRLGPLQDNGGQTLGIGGITIPTMALRAGSPAINTGDPAACPARDERGFLRVPNCDVGAFEVAFPVWLPLVAR